MPVRTVKTVMKRLNSGIAIPMNGPGRQRCLPEPVKNRYPACPESWMRFISAVKSMGSKDEKVWFLCMDDYEVQGDKAWQWNEWELISLKAAEDDAAWSRNLRNARPLRRLLRIL